MRQPADGTHIVSGTPSHTYCDIDAYANWTISRYDASVLFLMGTEEIQKHLSKGLCQHCVRVMHEELIKVDVTPR